MSLTDVTTIKLMKDQIKKVQILKYNGKPLIQSDLFLKVDDGGCYVDSGLQGSGTEAGRQVGRRCRALGERSRCHDYTRHLRRRRRSM